MPNKKILLLSGLIILLFFTDCKKNVLYRASTEIQNKTWQIGDSICFNTEIKDTKNYYNIFINLNIDENFLTENIWLFVKSTSPSGNILNDTVMFYITDKNGKWLGKKHGNTIKNKFLYKPHVKFPETGNYKFCLNHGMRKNDLPKINSVGISIEKSE
ncbi:MAG: gliding motility lipoprotein GldH [Chlorobi bacterium]|nr:gliding motility lipoprotein GldH [Chlorobiota bacterium]